MQRHRIYVGGASAPHLQQELRRYELRTGRREIDRSPRFAGETIRLQGLDGFFAAGRGALYAVGHAGGGRIGGLVSGDNGSTWRDHALCEPFEAPYAVGGCRQVTADGYVIGSFTARTTPGSGPEGVSQVRFLKVPTGPGH